MQHSDSTSRELGTPRQRVHSKEEISCLYRVEPSHNMGRFSTKRSSLWRSPYRGGTTRRTCIDSCISTQRLDGSVQSARSIRAVVHSRTAARSTPGGDDGRLPAGAGQGSSPIAMPWSDWSAPYSPSHTTSESRAAAISAWHCCVGGSPARQAGLMRLHPARVPAPKSGFAGFHFPSDVILVQCVGTCGMGSPTVMLRSCWPNAGSRSIT